ncbi:2-oxoadipate dioxygenase/decarboxylase family protein [Ideonella sp. BN130291]|uniref:2-oxoadipate dioxygenase/decarboxylase family protein n=1 Tax=Ideonella sp. BN130291 TaxID=3112940 RepID=UPI002E265BA5|nr:DUF1338 family protein [Ideonella sp. BN130291]
MPFQSNVRRLLDHRPELVSNARLWSVLQFPQPITLNSADPDVISRAELSFGLGLVLFSDLLRRVPEADHYLQRVYDAKGQIVFDHGALRTVAWPSGELPPGEAAFTRFLSALGYRLGGTYPLPRLKMTGRSYVHEDLPEDLPQYFVSELHPERFSERFQQAVSRVVGSSGDPLSPADLALVERLRRDKALQLDEARRLLEALVRCFDRQHADVRLADYDTLLAESPEMAWIATEGNVFNHATDRVADVHRLAEQLRRERYSIKASVEVSATGRVRQTALKAAEVMRSFVHEGQLVTRAVPGSFYEFISRDRIEAAAGAPLDLSFDSGNATGIFKMTAAEVAA